MLPSKELFEAKIQSDQLTPLSLSSALTAQVTTGKIPALVMVCGFVHSWWQLSEVQQQHTPLPLMLSQPLPASSEPDGSSFTEGKILASFLRGFYSCSKPAKIFLIKLTNMCLRHRPTPGLRWNNTSGAGLCYSPPQKMNESLSIHHNSLATEDTDSSIILFLPKLAGTVCLCSSVWCVCIFPPLSLCQLFSQDGFWLSPGGTGNQHALSPGTPTAENSLGDLPLKEKYYAL